MARANMKKLGMALMSLGFLAGAFFLVQYPAHIAWLPYGVALAVTAVGAALARVASMQSGGESAQLSADIGTIRQSLKELLDRVAAINTSDREGDKLFDVSKRIDDECMEPINAFVEAREAMIHRFGLASYASLMDSFALGERALNRAWCAAADGYIDEVNLCLDRAQNHLGAALAIVEACLSADEATEASTEPVPSG